ncbi:transcription-repair-coupling factor [Synergistales bacterium]|nr:transcription-repair-coupling factor [Synergistales bacterium]
MSEPLNEAFPARLPAVNDKMWRGRTLHMQSRGAARAWICRAVEFSLLVILPDSRQVMNFVADADSLRTAPQFADMPPVCALPEIAIASFADNPQLEAQKAERGAAMGRWTDRGGMIAATPGALMGPVSLGGDRLTLLCGEETSRAGLIEWLAQKGYERADTVWSPGQFTYRGGIVDFFDPKDSYPTRIEFFDEEIESMRFFATDTQRSVSKFSRGEVRAISGGRSAAISDLFPPDTHVLLVEPQELENAAESYAWLRAGVENNYGALDHNPNSTRTDEQIEWREVSNNLSLYPRMRLTSGIANANEKAGVMGLPNFRGRRKELELYCASLESRGIFICVASETDYSLSWADKRGYAALKGSISEGFLDTNGRAALIGDFELSGISLAGTSPRRALPLDWADRLLPGQWVVHDDYGVARYMGSELIETQDGPQEYLTLEYANDQKLKIPVTHFNKISPYKTYPGAEPAADNLRGKHWKKLSARAKEQAEEAAKYLIDVYAKREASPGYSFKGDEEQEREFERAFPYRETADQLRAIEDVTRDMERPVPMDRLIIGDVGFGKTEIALRASARAVFDGRQVVLMAPTTLLAQQHYETFSARFEQFGARVEVLSRFVTPPKQRAVIEDLSAGKVDIVIGTHRLLGADIKFRDVGLVIVDEEHRFGVMHKERLKETFPSVDVLMISATPIPRSLHMSLSGLRDMSVLGTPPQKRLPIITAVAPRADELVKNAVIREKARGGQIFYVHNRVQTIEREATTLRRLFPKLRICVAHGQMPEKQLKIVMDKFANAEFDMLVCTTIVESGLDIPRANTMIVSDSQELGIAQMHQLRGRVGRRDEQAFALFLYPVEGELTKDARERLDAISALGDFGAGYELARKDLEIRGGGELVGTAQHGNIGRVGFQKYCDLLEEAIKRAKGDHRESVEAEIGIPSTIPKEYLPHDSVRVALYRRLLWTRDIDALRELADETADRFGPMPKVLKFLFDVARIKIIGPDYMIVKVVCGRDETVIEQRADADLPDIPTPKGWFRLMNGFTGRGGYDALGEFAECLKSD